MVDIPNTAEAEIVSRRAFLSGGRSLRSPQEALQPDHAPPPPIPPKKRPRQPIAATASGILSFLGLAAIALAVGWSIAVQRLQAPGPLQTDKVVDVSHADTGSIVDQLVEEGVVDNRYLMLGAIWLEGERNRVKHGEYEFKQNASLQDVLDTLVSGKQILHAITIPEGLTSQQIVERMNADDLLSGTIPAVPPEGSLMPSTYKFARGFDREKLIKKMGADYTDLLNDVWSRRSANLPIHSAYEMVTLASIVEKETGRADERPRVAGVFINRLARNIPLQSDPTIVYGLVGGKGTLGRGILKSEVEEKTPYNTYAISGLPPGPIANPGKAALEAVVNPSRTKDLYFVADGTGGHAFAESFDQHRQNVARWRQIEKDAKDRLDPDADKAVPAAATAQPPASRPNQRGDLSNPGVFGIIGENFDAAGRPAVAAFSLSGLAGSALPTHPSAPTVARAASSNLDDLDIEVAGERTKPETDLEDGSGVAVLDQLPAGSAQSFPVPAGRLADQRAQAKALGLPPASNGETLPRGAVAALANEAPAVSNERFGRGKVIDASEGTSLDPLRDKGYDLNSAKTVPVLRSLPPLPAISSTD